MSLLSCRRGRALTTNILISNRGRLPTATLGVVTPLAAPFAWGPPGDGGSFPGGTGLGQLNTDSNIQGAGITYPMSYDYCTSQALGPGQQCLVSVSLSPDFERCSASSAVVDIAYSDAVGPVLPTLSWAVEMGYDREPDGGGCVRPP